MELGHNSTASPTAVLPPRDWVRFPLWRKDFINRRDFRKRAIAGGKSCILVLDRNSCTTYQWQYEKWEQVCGWWHTRIPDADYIEVLNEADGVGDSSSHKPKEVYWAFIRAAHKTWPNAKVIAGGLVFIDFSYLDGISDAGADIAAFHPYAQTGDTVGALTHECRKHIPWDMPLWATEFGANRSMFDNEHDRAVWFSDMIVGLWKAGVEVALVYRYDYSPGGDFEVAGLESEAAIEGAVAAVAGDPPSSSPVLGPSAFYWGADVSNFQPDDLTGIVNDNKLQALMIRSFLDIEKAGLKNRTHAQFVSACGLLVPSFPYCWGYGTSDPTHTVDDALIVPSQVVEVRYLAVDCETYVVNGQVADKGPNADWLRIYVAECRARGIKPVIYTGEWWWREYMGNTTEFGDVLLIAANYNVPAGLQNVPLFGGWTIDNLVGHQYQGNPIDLDIFRADLFLGPR